VEELKQNNAVLEKESRILLQQKKDITQTVKRELRGQLSDEFSAQAQLDQTHQNRRFGDLLNQLDSLKRKVGQNNNQDRDMSRRNADTDIPIGFGLNEDMATTQGGRWLMPLDMTLEETLSKKKGETDTLATGGNARPGTPVAAQTKEPEPAKPKYTIPRGGTLISGTAFTALLGRIPINNRVQDPFPFKVLVGPENLAARGIYIPNLKGMIVGGIATGDWNLSCVRGDILYTTYVFDDGTVSTYESMDGENEPIGYLSDGSGIPCVSGELKSNAAAFLTSRVGLMALEAAGSSAVSDATTTQFNNNGGAIVSIDNASQNALGRILSGGASEARRWIDQRQKQSFEVIFAPPGITVTINIEEEITIDLDPNERKVAYGPEQNPYTTSRLD